MIRNFRKALVLVLLCLCGSVLPGIVHAQNSASLSGTVTDPTGAVVPKATVEIHNPVSGYDRTTTTDTSGNFSFSNIPYNPYHLTVSLSGFNSFAQDVDVKSSVPVNLKIGLSLAGATSNVTVEASAEDLLENTPTEHTDVDRNLFEELPLESASSSISSRHWPRPPSPSRPPRKRVPVSPPWLDLWPAKHPKQLPHRLAFLLMLFYIPSCLGRFYCEGR